MSKVPGERLCQAVNVRLACLAALLFARRNSLAMLQRTGIRRILVVCYGNICRSAFVAAYFRKHSIPGVEVRSAGVHPKAGRPAPQRHVEMSLKHGVDLREHRSAIVEAADLAWADLIVIMDRHNWHALIDRGANPDKLAWLGALGNGPVEIPDPFPMTDAGAFQVVEQLSSCSQHMIDLIRN